MNNELKIFYPFKPFLITQRWGNQNSAYSTQFNDPDFKLHNGVDANPGVQEWNGKLRTEYPVYCPVEGFTVKKVDYAPQGGGNELWLISDQPLQMFDKKLYAYIPLCHAKKILVKAGDQPKLGQLLMIGDNTGFSTGLHTHMGLYRVGYNGYDITKVDVNSAEGSFDPSLFFTKEYAIDKAVLSTFVSNGLLYWRYLTGLT